MTVLRGEEQSGFLEILGNWLPHQPWFPAARGRWALNRIGGLRLPAPAGDADPHLFLELHLFEVELPDRRDETLRICVPLALRSRPSALAGKSAFIGKLTTTEGEDIWVYDGARDRAFLTALLEMIRRRQGSRNGRSRGEPLAGFDQWDQISLDLRRSSVDSPLPAATRTLIQPVGTTEDGDWEKKLTVDFLRRPATDHDITLETALTLTRAHSKAVPRVLGTVSGAWEERFTEGDTVDLDWTTGIVAVVREAGTAAPDAFSLARSALQSGRSFKSSARQLGETLGNFHADLAGSFGSHPQTEDQLKSMAQNAQQALSRQWERVRDEFDEDEAADLNEVIDLMGMQLRDADEPLMLQTIHGDLAAHHLHQISPERWVISEAGGTVEHALGLRDVVTVLMSLANTVMDVASETPEIEDAENGSADPVNFGQWYEELSSHFLEGYRGSDGDSAGVDSVFFRAAMLAEALELFSRWEGQWVFRPSMLLQVEG